MIQLFTKFSSLLHSRAMAMNFPSCFHFASMLLSSEKGVQAKFYSKCTLGAPKLGQMQKMQRVFAAAASYIA